MFMAILIGLHFYIWQIDGEDGKKRPISIYQKSYFGNKIREMYYSLLCPKYEFEDIKIVL